jgi:hypothetical protein
LGRACPLCPDTSDLDLLSDGKRVIDLNAEIPDRTFQLRVAKQQLDRTEVAGAAVDQGRLRAAERVSGEDVRVQSDARNPFRDEPRILACCHGLAGPSPAGEQKFRARVAGRPEVFIKGLTGVLGQLEADRTAGLFLAHRCPCERLAVRGNVFDLHRDDIAASQLAIDGQIEHCQIAGSPFDLKLGPNGPDVPCQKRRLCSDELPLVPRRTFRCGQDRHLLRSPIGTSRT